MNILILDDEPRFSREMREKLENNQFSVTEVRSIEEAKAKLRTKRFDGAIIDIQLKTELVKAEQEFAGFKFAKYLQANHNIPFIFITQNFHNEEYNKRIEEMGLRESILFSKMQIDNEGAFIASLLDAFERHFAFSEDDLSKTKTPISWRLGFYVNDGNANVHYDFFDADEVLYFVGDTQRRVDIVTNRAQSRYKYSSNLNHLVLQVEKKWSNFIRLGTGHYVNLHKIQRFRRLPNGRGHLYLHDTITGISEDFTLTPAGVASLIALGVIVAANHKAE